MCTVPHNAKNWCASLTFFGGGQFVIAVTLGSGRDKRRLETTKDKGVLQGGSSRDKDAGDFHSGSGQ